MRALEEELGSVREQLRAAEEARRAAEAEVLSLLALLVQKCKY